METNPEPRKGIGCAAWVVLAVVLIVLVMMLLPGGGAREKAPRVRCLSDLKQLGLSMTLYAEENQGRFPMDAANPTLAGSLRMLSNTLSSTKVLVCPGSSDKPADSWSRLTMKDISYMYVPNLTTNVDPNAIVALDKTDCVHAGCQWPVSGNHKDAGGNVLFVDGHVSFNVKLPADLKDKDGVERFLSP
jgi:prepilin-type processing-associated H-X9-DG protein